MRFAVDPWDPAYGAAVDGEQADSAVPIDASVECALGQWAPIRPGVDAANDVIFVDGVRRVEARVWLPAERGSTELSVAAQCASWGAGAVLCRRGSVAQFGPHAVGRVLAAPPPGAFEPLQTRHATFEPVMAAGPTPPDVWLAVQEAMARGEHRISDTAAAQLPGALIVVDGPLRGRDHLHNTVGYVKTHQVRYLDDPEHDVLSALAPGQRTPMFLIGGGHPRLSWYVRLADTGPANPMSTCARVECPAATSLESARVLADLTAVTLTGFASEPHKDRRAPQNLFPIAGLERRLRHLLGDPQLMYRSLRSAAHGIQPPAVNRV